MKTKEWIGVDLDGTLATYNGLISEKHIGDPIPRMAERVRMWLADGKDVRIFTARVDGGNVAITMGNQAGELFRDVDYIREIIQDWTEEHFGVRLPVTNQKDYGMVELWDDRAVRVMINTGYTCCEQSDRIAALEAELAAAKAENERLMWMNGELKSELEATKVRASHWERRYYDCEKLPFNPDF